MGFLVVTTGRLLLPARLERQALTVAEHRMAGLEGGFDPERAPDVDELSDLAAFAGVALTREGDWLTVSTDLRGDPKWSEQAEEFYRSLGGFVQEGEVHLRAQDGSSWSYAYSPTGVERSRTQAADAQPETPPRPQTPPSPEAPSPGPTPPAPEPTPPPEPDDFIDYPGREQSPPPTTRPTEPPARQPWDAGTPPPPADQPPTGPPQSYRDLQLPHDDDARPSPPGRALLMTVVLVVGVLLIIGLALLASGGL